MAPQLLLRRFPSAGAHLCRYQGHAHRRRLSSASEAAGGPGWRRQHEEESKAVKVSVWWDFENCHVPQNVNVCRVAQRVSAALRAAGVRGPLSITAFGDVVQLSRAAQEALVATGVVISHVPSSGKNSSDRSFMADLVYWIAQNPPPAHFFLISGDKDFANILHRLRMSNYNILLACPGKTTSVLCNAATIMWPWEALVKGENFSPKRFNHPPDGLSGSWYGHYKGALDDPFVEAESEETIATPVPSDAKLCHNPKNAVTAVPKDVVDGIRETLNSYPSGVKLSILLQQLKKNNVPLGNDFFGHKKLSCLLLSMPDIVKFVTRSSALREPCVVGVNKKLLEPAEQCFEPLSSVESDVKDNNCGRATHNDKKPPSSVSTSFPEQNCKTLSSQSIIGDRSFKQTVSENPAASAVSSSPQDVLPEDQKVCPAADMNARPESLANHKEVDEVDAAGTPSFLGVENTVDSDGLLKRIWVLWNGPESANHEVSPCHEGTSAEVADLGTPQQDCNTDQRSRLLNRIHKTSSQNRSSDVTDGSAAMTVNFSTLSDHNHSEKHAEETEKLKRDPPILQNSKPSTGPASVPLCKDGGDTSKMSKGFFSWVMRWWKFGKLDGDNSIAMKNGIDEVKTDIIEESQSLKASTCGNEQQVVNKIFTRFYFWDVLGKQLSKPIGSELVSKAKTREELVHGLQNLDCWPLKGLVEKDVSHLVHLLLSEKKWIEETPSSDFPFRLTLPQKRTRTPPNSSTTSTPPNSSTTCTPPNSSTTCTPPNSSTTSTPPNSSKFDLSSLFNVKPLEQGKYGGDKGRTNRTPNREETLSDCHKLLKDLLVQYKYGFNISIFKRHFAQKHGYELDHQKLGYADIESLLQIMPGIRVKFPRVLPAENGNDQGGSKGDGNQSNGDDSIWGELGPVSATAKTAEGVDKETCYRPPTCSEDDFSDDENQAEQEPRRGAEQSSLLKIIDSWNGSKDGSGKKHQEIDGVMDCSRSSPGYLDTLRATRQQQQTQKQYSFVSSDLEEDESKDKLVDSVLGSLQKARGAKASN
uniref:HTH OST-type domain-containing protein n=1 Tax=Triticum urartu TaxID=4572 RepID=A0A8R7UD79_TRIUA